MKSAFLAAFLTLMISASASARTMLGCLRSFQLQPGATKDEQGHPDAFVPAVRGTKTGFYFFSGDDSGKSPLFIPLTADELKKGSFQIQFTVPGTKVPGTERVVSLIGIDCNPRQPLGMMVREIAPDPKVSRAVPSKEVESAQDSGAAGALDAFAAMVVSGEANLIANSSTGLGLRLPNMYPGMPNLGLNDPKLLKSYQQKKRGATDEIAQAYAKSGPDFLTVNDELISRYQSRLQQYCDGVGQQAKQAVKDVVDQLKATTALNARLKPLIKDGIEQTLPAALAAAKDKSFSSADRLKNFIAGHISARIADLRGELANKKALGDADVHAPAAQGAGTSSGPVSH